MTGVKKCNLLLLLMVLVTTMIACGDDDDDNSTISIAGHWYCVSESEIRKNTVTGAIVEYSDNNVSIDLKLYEDGTCNMNGNIGVYKVLGSELDVYLMVNNVEVYQHYTIEELKQTKMMLSKTEYVDKVHNGHITHWMITCKYAFER